MKSYRLKVENIVDETPDAYSLVFSAADETLRNYKPGQYLTLKLNIQGENVRRAFSLSSAPNLDSQLAVTIKRVEGGRASNYLRDKVKVGDEIEVLPPMGNFALNIVPTNQKHYILMGAGSGITPLMSMLKTVLAAEAQSKVTLWYGNRNEESIIFHQALAALQQKYGNRLEVVHILSQPSSAWTGETGRLDKMRAFKMLSDLFMKGDTAHKVYYMCGPNEMMQDLQSALHHQGVNPSDIFREYYSAPAPSDEDVAKVYEPVIATTATAAPANNVQGTKLKLILDG
ncbi:MAG: FAD-binding oxidoreductase, partial [Bacteroidia bacterium]